MEPNAGAYRVTIRYYDGAQRYEVFELRAGDLREALERAVDRFPDDAAGTADLVEIRRAHPADSG